MKSIDNLPRRVGPLSFGVRPTFVPDELKDLVVGNGNLVVVESVQDALLPDPEVDEFLAQVKADPAGPEAEALAPELAAEHERQRLAEANSQSKVAKRGEK